MKALVIDSYDHTKCCYEIAEVLVTNTVYVETAAGDCDTYEFPAVLNLVSTRGTEIYVVLPYVNDADALAMRFFNSDNVDLTALCGSTFINPGEVDLPKLESLLADAEL